MTCRVGKEPSRLAAVVGNVGATWGKVGAFLGLRLYPAVRMGWVYPQHGSGPLNWGDV